ncbi:MAG: CCA tRNA nucleotidyltransferase [Lentisphaeraceae bacterium]|nr:CCA tRNA nucleotidyltransferase [Lentisphaeraceae bacterium]
MKNLMLDFCDFFEHPIYVVGGCVRDELLGVELKDVDLASNLTPLEFKKLCKKKKLKTFDTGIEHGTITVLINGIPYEHTTFRKDVSCDGRNATIEFSETIEEDLSRRDFTINAIAKLDQEFIDPFDGRTDLKNGFLRTVGCARERFSEDFLRIIRAARFQSRFDLQLCPELLLAARQAAPKIIEHVSIERISDEIRKAQKNALAFIHCCENLGFLNEIFPAVKEFSDNDRKNWHIQIERASHLNELQFFAALLIPIAKEQSPQLAVYFRLGNHIKKGLAVLHEFHDSLDNSDITATQLRRLKVNCKAYYPELLQYIDEVLTSPENNHAGCKTARDLDEQVQTSIKKTFIDGAYLKKFDLTPGPWFKDILDQCGEAQAEGQNLNDIEVLAAKLIEQCRQN